MRRDPSPAGYRANRTLGVLSKMFNLAELQGLCPDGSNPCLHVKRFREDKRERFLSSEEFNRLGRVLDGMSADGSKTRSASALRLLMLTGCRLSEVQKLRWEHVDLDAGELRLPDTKTSGRPYSATADGVDRTKHGTCGREPVREWPTELPREDRRLIGRDIMGVEFGWPYGPPLCASPTNYPGLHEVRSNLTGKRIARVFFTVSGWDMMLLHGFIKKTKVISRKELMLAQRRMKEHDRHV